MERIRNLFFATDFSSASRPAYRRALAMTSGSRATLWIGHVIPAAPLADVGSTVPRVYLEMDEYPPARRREEARSPREDGTARGCAYADADLARRSARSDRERQPGSAAPTSWSSARTGARAYRAWSSEALRRG